MKSVMLPTIILLAALLVMLPMVGHSSANMEGTYTNSGGMVTLDLKSGGKGSITLMGETTPCIYKVKEDKLLLDCTPKGEKLDFMIHGDRSISGPGFIGNMKKSK